MSAGPVRARRGAKRRPARAEQGEGAAAAPSPLPRTTRAGKLSGQGQSRGERDGGFHSLPAAPRAGLPERTCPERLARGAGSD